MTINFFEQGGVPQPPDKVKIELLEAAPYEEGWRVGVTVHVTPFQKRPNLDIALFRKGDNKPVAHLSIIETMHPKMEFTMHLRGIDEPAGDYVLKAALFFREVEEDAQELPTGIRPTDIKQVDVTIEPRGETG